MLDGGDYRCDCEACGWWERYPTLNTARYFAREHCENEGEGHEVIVVKIMDVITC